MKMIRILLLASASLLGASSFAMTGADCIEIDGQGQEVDDGFKIQVRGEDNEPDKVKFAKMSDPGHADIGLTPTFYELSMPGDGTDHVTFSSNMTIESTRNNLYARIVTLGVSYKNGDGKGRGKWLGVAKIQLIDLKNVEQDSEVDTRTVQCGVK